MHTLALVTQKGGSGKSTLAVGLAVAAIEQGERVEFFPRAASRLQPVLEKAVLGSYEVLSCIRVSAGGSRWLDVRLRGVFSTQRLRRRPAHAASPVPEPSQQR